MPRDMRGIFYNSNITLDGRSVINTGIKLFSSENIDKDFKIVIENLYSDKSLNPSPANNDAIFSSKDAATPYPGFTCRPQANVATSNSNGNIWILDKTLFPGFVVSRVNGVISVGVLCLTAKTLAFSTALQNSGYYYALSKNGNLTTVTDVPFTLGGEMSADNVTGRRFCGGTIGNIVIAIKE